MEFWFSLVKVGALVLFLVIGVIFLISGHQVAGVDTGFTPRLPEWRHLPAWRTAGPSSSYKAWSSRMPASN